MKELDNIEHTSPPESTMSARSMPSENWYEKLYTMLLGNIPFSLL